jgi:hypothetical protein
MILQKKIIISQNFNNTEGFTKKLWEQDKLITLVKLLKITIFYSEQLRDFIHRA